MALPLFTVVNNAFPSFTTYYSNNSSIWGAGIAGNPPGFAGHISFLGYQAFQFSGNTYFAVFLSEEQAISGQVIDTPTPNREIIFKALSDGTFADVTHQFFSGASLLTGVSLNGSSGVPVPVQFPQGFALVLTESREDGRGANATNSNFIAQSQIELLQGDGTFKLLDLGVPAWSGKADVIDNQIYVP